MNTVYFFKKTAAALVLAAISFAGCDKDDEGGAGSPSPVTKITAKVENGASYNTAVDNVKALIEHREYDGETSIWKEFPVGSGAYADGGFTIDLPATVDAKYLETIFGDEVPAGVTVSDPKAATGFADDFIAYKSDAPVGEFAYCNYDPYVDEEPTAGVSADYVYADRDVTVSGSVSGMDDGWTNNNTYNCSLKKGWNIVYYTWTENRANKTYTSTMMTGTAPAVMKWWYAPDSDEASGSSATTNITE